MKASEANIPRERLELLRLAHAACSRTARCRAHRINYFGLQLIFDLKTLNTANMRERLNSEECLLMQINM